MSKVIPVLDIQDTDTWVNSPLAKGGRLLANYFVTDRWQSTVYSNKVYSVVDILLEYPDDNAKMISLVKSNITEMFTNHFDEVNVEVSMPTSNTLVVGITWFSDGVPYSISNYQTQLDVLMKVINLNNTGRLSTQG